MWAQLNSLKCIPSLSTSCDFLRHSPLLQFQPPPPLVYIQRLSDKLNLAYIQWRIQRDIPPPAYSSFCPWKIQLSLAYLMTNCSSRNDFWPKCIKPFGDRDPFRPAEGAYGALPDPQLDWKGPLCGREVQGRDGMVRTTGKRGGIICYHQFLDPPLLICHGPFAWATARRLNAWQ